MEEKEKQLEEVNVEAAETKTPEIEAVADEMPWEAPAEIEVETKKEKKVKKKEEKEAAKAKKVAKKKKRAERRNTKAAKFIRRAAIWLLAILVIFLGGYALSHIMVAGPTKLALEEARSDLAMAEEEIASLQGEVEDLSSFEAANESLERDMEDVNTHITVLSARVAVTGALISLHDGELAEVRLKLDKVKETLKVLKTMLNADQRDVVTSMEQRLELVVGELDEDTTAAEMDLKVLSGKLISLENTLFANP